MTLAQMATLVCKKINMQQTNDLAACKEYLTRRQELIWVDALWKDALVSYTQSLSPTGYTTLSTWLPTKGILLCPPIIDQVVAARLDSNSLNVQRQEYYYRVTWDAFAQSGTPTQFVVLPSCVWEWETAQATNLLCDVGDAGMIATLDTLDTDAINITRRLVNSAVNQGTFPATERIETFTKPTTTGDVYLGTLLGITCVNSSAGAVTFSTVAGSVVVAAFSTGICPSRAGMTYIAADYGGPSENIAGDFSNYFGTASTSGVGTLAYDGAWYGASSTTALITVAAANTAAARRQRIRLLSIPPQTVTIRILGKRVCPTFTADNDEPAIPVMTNCLLAFALGDMLERARRYGQAEKKMEEALALLDQLKRVETVQQAHNIHIEPQEGFQGPYDFHTAGWAPFPF